MTLPVRRNGLWRAQTSFELCPLWSFDGTRNRMSILVGNFSAKRFKTARVFHGAITEPAFALIDVLSTTFLVRPFVA